MPNIEGSPVEDAAKKAMKQYEDATKAYAEKQRAQAAAVQQVANKAAPEVETDQWGVPLPKWTAVEKAAAAVPESVGQYQQTIEAKRLPSAPYDAKTAAMLVPESVDKYQAQIEAPRVLPGHSLGEPTTAPASKSVTPTKSKVAQLLAAMKAEETSAKGKPNIADIIEAASAGWGGRKASYLEKQATEAERAAEIEDLAKRAQLEEALQESQFAHDVELAKLKLGGMAAPSLAGLTPGQVLGAKLMSGIGGQ